MTPPRRMFELQLGHLCNDRCVFCISGRLTSRRQAPLLAPEMLAERMRRAHASGHRAITFLGGEPTIQPYFLDLVKLAVSLGFERIVIFTNGSKAGRTALVDEVIATGGSFEWRFSFQGATEAAHEATTRRKGSFRQLLRAVERVAAHGQRITANACVVAQNYASLGAFPALLDRLGVGQLHVDMIHPEDTGNLSLEELAPMMVRYSEIVPHLREMVNGFPVGFDVNVGNVPQCLAPDLAPFVHHGGEPTETSQAHDFGLPVLQLAKDKYARKERRKVKLPGCRECAFDARCTGLFPEYVALFGAGELHPVREAPASAPRSWRDAERAAIVRALAHADAVTGARTELREEGDDGFVAEAIGASASDGAAVALAGADTPGASASFQRGAVRLVGVRGSARAACAWLRALQRGLGEAGWRSRKPLGDDLVAPSSPKVRSALQRWRAAAPFGALEWRDVALEDEGARAVLTLADRDGVEVRAWVGPEGHGYRLAEGDPATASIAIRLGVHALFDALRRPRDAPQPR